MTDTSGCTAATVALLLLVACADQVHDDGGEDASRDLGHAEGGAEYVGRVVDDAGADAGRDASIPGPGPSRDAMTEPDASFVTSPEAGADAAVVDACKALESSIVEELERSRHCSTDADCEVIYNPLCGAASILVASGCFLYVNASADAAPLTDLANACSANGCTEGCMPADCDCPELPQASCVGGVCRAEVMEAELSACSEGVECIVVPYDHCCGSTKRAINSALLGTYEEHPAWQRFDDAATCAVIGVCRDDTDVSEATCVSGQCELVYP